MLEVAKGCVRSDVKLLERIVVRICLYRCQALHNCTSSPHDGLNPLLESWQIEGNEVGKTSFSIKNGLWETTSRNLNRNLHEYDVQGLNVRFQNLRAMTFQNFKTVLFSWALLKLSLFFFSSSILLGQKYNTPSILPSAACGGLSY